MGEADRLPAFARVPVQLRLDAIMAIGATVIRAVKSATTTVPVVFLTNVDPVAAGLVPNLVRPGGNVTGILTAPDGTLAAKKLELFKEMVPRASRIALPV